MSYRPTKAQAEVLAIIGEPMTPIEIARATGRKRSAAWNLCDQMRRRGLLVKAGGGKYWFAEPEKHGAEK